MASTDRTKLLLPAFLISACGLQPAGTPVASSALCEEIARVVCDADTACFPANPVTDCMEVQVTDCEETVQPMLDDPRLAYDPARAGAFIAELEGQADACWATPLDPDRFFEVFAGTGAPGADCTPPDLEPTSLRTSALSCRDGNACRVHLRADGSVEGVCESRSGLACSHAFDCSAGEFCSLPSSWQPGVWGECRPLRTDGWACTTDLECASRYCDGTCMPRPAIQRPLRVDYPTAVLGAEPIAFLRSSELSGRLYDASGHARSAELVGSPTFEALGAAPGDETGAVRFSGDGQYAILRDMSAIPEGNPLSLEVWFFVEDAERTQPILEVFDGVALGPHVWNYDRGDKLYANFVAVEDGGNTIMSSEGAVSLAAWHHAVATYDGDVGRLYLDGERIGETALATDLHLSGDLHIGHRGPLGDGEDRYFSGMIDEIAVYDRALTETEIRAHRDAGFTGAIENRFPLFQWLAP